MMGQVVVGRGDCRRCSARNGDNHNSCSGVCANGYNADEFDDDEVPAGTVKASELRRELLKGRETNASKARTRGGRGQERSFS